MAFFDQAAAFLAANSIVSVVAFDMTLALVLGFLFGYERSYHGRAAGMRTYGLVCMVAATLVSLSSHPQLWLDGTSAGGLLNMTNIDPTRTVQGIVTGVGFLGAGIIMQNGTTISGLTTAASIWAAAAIGILVGMGFYADAVWMTIVAEMFVMMGMRFDALLPSRRPVAVSMHFKKGFVPAQGALQEFFVAHGYDMALNSIVIHHHGEQTEWRFVVVSRNRRRPMRLTSLAEAFAALEGVDGYNLSRARN